jgi:hypothetical protein
VPAANAESSGEPEAPAITRHGRPPGERREAAHPSMPSPRHTTSPAPEHTLPSLPPAPPGPKDKASARDPQDLLSVHAQRRLHQCHEDLGVV